ncbi:MAG: ABC transporter ATP-binding protein [Nitrospinota bacterium]|nr:MAG: ABC transporter ATP-binding protein [Nitrospinota bacterium]
MILELEDVVAVYGFSRVLQGVSLAVDRGEVVTLLGRNGAGKTTTLRSIMGLVRLLSGRIRFRDIEIQGKPPFEIARLGIGYVPDDRRIFPDLSVEGNLLLALRHSPRSQERTWPIERVYELFPPLQRFRKRRGSYLSGGEQKMLAIGRALVTNPYLLLLDEPSEGLSPLIVRDLLRALHEIRDSGITILLADQNLKFARQIAQRGYILDKGRIQYQGTMEEIWENEEVVRRYLAV